MTETDWTLKIMALLHDSPGKALALEWHQRRAFELMERVIGAQEFQARMGKPGAELTRREFENTPEGKAIKEADQIASAIDRAAFPNQTRLKSEDFIKELQVRHPFCAEPLPLSWKDKTEVQPPQDLLQFVVGQPDARRKYLALWRLLPLLSPDPVTRLLPPDTRIIDHTLWAHADVTSGLVSALPTVAVLKVAIGPVQTFIYEARRTQDLWMGSYLLSFLAWSGIQAIAEAYGPDAVLYPALRSHPLADLWLEQEIGPLPPAVTRVDITIAATPNQFVALVPADQVEDIAQEVTKKVRATWQEIAEAVHKEFPGGSRSGIWQEIWNRQVNRSGWPEVYWSAVLWPDTNAYPTASGAEEALRRVEACLGPRPLQRKRLNLYRQSWERGTNVGAMYDVLYELLSVALDARKRTRDFSQAEEDGEKCTVSPSFSALRTAERQSRSEVRRYWREVAEKLRKQGRAHELLADGRERLSAIAAIKRFAQRSYFADKHKIFLYFPSTSRIAAVAFYKALFEKLSTDGKVQQALQKHLEALEQLGYPTVSAEAAEGALPGLWKEIEQLPEDIQANAKSLLRYDADVLYPERLEPEVLEREYDFSNRQSALRAQKTCRDLRQAVDLAPPTYYAILLMDGDDMGKWLAGKHKSMPAFQEVMHPAVLPKFDGLPNAAQWAETLELSRPLAANLHASLSAALSTFAWRCVRWVVEERHFGRVVYAGGDDVLAILPPAEVMPAARELYALFTGHAEVRNGKLEIRGESDGFLKWEDEIFLMPGPRITLSAGIAVVHHLYPLDAALAAARTAVRTAKQVPDKAAVGVTVLKRSGEAVTMRSKWHDIGDLFAELVEHFTTGRLSSRFAYDLSDRAPIFTALPSGARTATLKQLVQRHKTDALAEAKALQLVERLAGWAQALDTQTLPEVVDGTPVYQGLAELARWVVFAHFVATGGNE